MDIFWNAKDRTILNQILQALDEADEIWIAVAYIKKSGLNLLHGELKKALSKGSKVTIVTGTDFCLTEPEAITELLDMFNGNNNATLFFANTQDKASFHPKTYCFVKGAQAVIIAGSSNFTAGGLKDNTELCVSESVNIRMQPFISMMSFFEDIRNSGNAQKVTPLILEGYRSRYLEFQKHQKLANSEFQKWLREQKRSVLTLTETIVKKYCDEYRKAEDVDKTMKERCDSYLNAKRILDQMATNPPNTSTDFIALYERLVNPKGYWWSGSLFRSKNKIMQNYKAFVKMIYEVKMSNEMPPDELFEFCLKYKHEHKINGLGVNVITEIMHTYRPNDCPLLNQSPIISLAKFGYSDFPNAPDFRGRHYRRLKQVLEEINNLCGFGSLGMADNYLHYVYRKLKKESKATDITARRH